MSVPRRLGWYATVHGGRTGAKRGNVCFCVRREMWAKFMSWFLPLGKVSSLGGLVVKPTKGRCIYCLLGPGVPQPTDDRGLRGSEVAYTHSFNPSLRYFWSGNEGVYVPPYSTCLCVRRHGWTRLTLSRCERFTRRVPTRGVHVSCLTYYFWAPKIFK